MKIGKIAQKVPNVKWAQIFLQAHNSHQKTKRMSIAKLNSVQWLERKCLRLTHSHIPPHHTHTTHTFDI